MYIYHATATLRQLDNLRKMPSGRTKTIPGIGTFRTYSDKTGARRFSVTDCRFLPAAGGYKAKTIVESVRFELGC